MEKKSIAIIVDSCTDVPSEEIERHGMYVVPLQVNYRNESFLDKVTITPQQVYDRFVEEIPSTSTPSPALVREVLDRVVADGYRQAVIVTISSGLSATYDLMRSETIGLPELECVLVDTKNIGMGAGLVALAVARKVEEGASLADIAVAAPCIVENTKVYFCVDTLKYLYQGGRIGEVTYRMGSLLDMRPVISCNENGVYYTVCKAKGRRQSLKKTLACAKKHASHFERCSTAVVDGDAAVEAQALAQEVRAQIPGVERIYQGQISPVLVVHTGPGLIGIGVQGE